jgi:hypothetical protein
MFSFQQQIAYCILAFLVLVITLCLFNVLYNLLLYVCSRNGTEEEGENITIVLYSN